MTASLDKSPYVAGGRDRLVALKAARSFVPASVGVKGWVALRLEMPAVDWRAFNNLALVGW